MMTGSIGEDDELLSCKNLLKWRLLGVSDRIVDPDRLLVRTGSQTACIGEVGVFHNIWR